PCSTVSLDSNDAPIATGTGLSAGGIWPQQACDTWGPGMNTGQTTFGVTIASDFSDGSNVCTLDILYSHLKEIWPLHRSLPSKLVLSRSPSSVHIPEQFVVRAACVDTLFNLCHDSDAPYAFLLASAPNDAPLFPKLGLLT
ncbi:hypothetical protein DFH29DRAFT_801058, partial [Suillus ampliporus]